MTERAQRKVRTGVVISSKMDKTVIVRVQRQIAHAKYGRIMRQNKKFAAHDEKKECSEGDIVKIMETRPLSKTKRWRVFEVVSKAK
jgi:small subunit ribosomal protein S17